MTGNLEQIINRMEQLVNEASPEREKQRPRNAELEPIAQKHRDAVRKGAEKDSNE